MKRYARHFIAALIAAAMLVSFSACAKTPENGGGRNISAEPVTSGSILTPRPDFVDTSVHISITIDARNAYVDPNLPAEVKAQLIGEGLLMKDAQISMPKSACTISGTFRVLQVSGLPVIAEESDGGSFITSISGVANGQCGEESRWLILINGEICSDSVTEKQLSDGDTVLFIYTVDGGNDLENPGSSVPSANPAATGMPDGSRHNPEGSGEPVTADPNSRTAGD